MSRVKKHKMKKWVRVVILIALISFFIIDAYMIGSSFYKGNVNKKEISYIYRIKGSPDFKVYLYPNSYIDKEYLKMDESYIADLIKSIDTTFKYQYYSSRGIDLNYKYNIKAIIQGEYKLNDEDSTSKVWTKEYEIADESGTNKDTYQFNINHDVKINYSYYNDVVTNFRKELKLPINATLNIVFNVTVNGKIENNTVTDTKSMSMTIPLNQQIFKITTHNIEDISKQFYRESDVVVDQDSQNNKLMIGVILFAINLILSVLLFRPIFDIKVKTPYIKAKRKYLKEYGDIIIEITNPVIVDNHQILDVTNFAEMVDLEEELRIPITFYEYPDEEYGEFTIIHNEHVYRYILEDK